jgi:FkbH-like protein
MKYFIFRNYTIEPFFKEIDACFSGYEDISYVNDEADCYVWFYMCPYEANNETVAEKIKNYGKSLELIHSKLNPNKQFIVFTIQPIYKINYLLSNIEIEKSIWTYNETINLLSNEKSNIKIIDISTFFSSFSQEQLIDWKYYYLSQMPLNPKLSSGFKQWFERQIEIVTFKRKKCIILDLDNTLWGGILGEDGIERIKIGETYPGNAYRFFQEYLLQLYKTGIILAICSKNNEQDVLEVLEKHSDMALRKEHFVCSRINWENKADNIKEIALELNIGLDSLVFIDDNPSERELVKQMLPEVTVPDFPQHPYHFPKLIKYLSDNYFSTYKLTHEDAVKTQQYKENAGRFRFQSQFADFEVYLKSLEIELMIEPLNDINIARFSQLTHKTNQFNLTTRRYTETDILNFVERKAWIYGLRVKDRFGDNGITGLIIIDINDKNAQIDTFLLSCRILGKKIEDVFAQYMLMKLKKSGIQSVKASYIKTMKNGQVSTFYERIGFSAENILTDKKDYTLALNDYNYVAPDIYKIIEI